MKKYYMFFITAEVQGNNIKSAKDKLRKRFKDSPDVHFSEISGRQKRTIKEVKE